MAKYPIHNCKTYYEVNNEIINSMDEVYSFKAESMLDDICYYGFYDYSSCTYLVLCHKAEEQFCQSVEVIENETLDAFQGRLCEYLNDRVRLQEVADDYSVMNTFKWE